MDNMRPELSQLKISCQEKTFSESVSTDISDVDEFKELSVRPASDFISALCH